MRFFVVLATLGTLAACNTAGTNNTIGVGTAPDTTLGDQIASPTEGFETETAE